MLLMVEIGLREVRQNASELVRRAQAGERLTITVSGRPAASLGPVDLGFLGGRRRRVREPGRS